MRLLHTADWHLGRILCGRSLIEDQARVLDEFVRLVGDTKPDAVVIAGDVYDRAVPPADAVRLLDEVLERIVVGHRLPLLLIAGNHDSGERLGFGASLLAARGLHVAGPAGGLAKLRLRDRHGEVDVLGLPYAEPAQLRIHYAVEGLSDHAEAMRLQLDALHRDPAAAPRRVLVAHAFVIGAEASDSERPLSVGGSGAIGVECFAGFDYVALGHLHRPQSLAGGRVHYAGSLMKYSFAEAAQRKSVSLVELGAPGELSIETIALNPPRDLRIIEGTLAGLLDQGHTDPRAQDYVHARITDAGALLEPMNRLRTAYPNALSLERLVLARSGEGVSRVRRPALDTTALFADFLREVGGEDLDHARRAAFEAVLRRLGGEGRDAA